MNIRQNIEWLALNIVVVDKDTVMLNRDLLVKYIVYYVSLFLSKISSEMQEKLPKTLPLLNH